MMADMCGWVGWKVGLECTKNFYWVASTVYLQSYVYPLDDMYVVWNS
jgi:hypothetical protein